MRWLLIGILALVMVACARPDDETRIRQHIEAMTSALADADQRAFLAPLATDFSAATWDLDRRAVQLLLMREFGRHDRIRARVFDLDVLVFEDDRAQATFQAVLTGGSGLLPEQGSWYRVTTGWRRTGSDWELIVARWDRVAGR